MCLYVVRGASTYINSHDLLFGCRSTTSSVQRRFHNLLLFLLFFFAAGNENRRQSQPSYFLYAILALDKRIFISGWWMKRWNRITTKMLIHVVVTGDVFRQFKTNKKELEKRNEKSYRSLNFIFRVVAQYAVDNYGIFINSNLSIHYWIGSANMQKKKLSIEEISCLVTIEILFEKSRALSK